MNKEQVIVQAEFNVALDILFQAWTKAEFLANWWSREGWSVVVRNLDLRVDGYFFYRLNNTNKGEFIWGKHTYKTIVPKQCIEFVESYVDEDELPVANPWRTPWPNEVLTRIEFIDKGESSEILITQSPVNSSIEEVENYRSSIGIVEAEFQYLVDQLHLYLKGI